MRLAALIVLLALAACAAGEPLPPIQGPWMVLNGDRWQPNAAELQAIKALPEQ